MSARRTFLRLLLLLPIVWAVPTQAAEPKLPETDRTLSAQARYELDLVLDRIRSKLRKGERTEKALGPELLELDTLIANYAGTDAETAAEFLFVKAVIYAEALRQRDTAKELFLQLKRDYPKALATMKADAWLAKLGA